MEEHVKTPLLTGNSSQPDAESQRSACSSLHGSDKVSSQTIRKPFHYPVGEQGRVMSDTDVDIAATYSRYRYYSKLAPPSTQLLAIPDHVLPPQFFVPFFGTRLAGEQSSFVTIFAIWNTMMGTSLLTMPWAVSQAGFAAGMALILGIGFLCLYTAFRVLSSPRLVGGEEEGHLEFSDICRHFLGPWGERLAMLFSMLPLLGATIVFWVLMSTFLSNTAVFAYDHISGIIQPEDIASGALAYYMAGWCFLNNEGNFDKTGLLNYACLRC